MTTTVRAESPADLLALIPAVLGFRPHESLIIIPFAGNRSIAALRTNVHEDVTPSYVTDFLMQHAPEATSVVFAAFTTLRVDVAERVMNRLMPSLEHEIKGMFIVDPEAGTWLDHHVYGVDSDGWEPWSKVTESPMWARSAEAWATTPAGTAPKPSVAFMAEVSELVALGKPSALNLGANPEVTAEAVASLVLKARGGKIIRDAVILEFIGITPTGDESDDLMARVVLGDAPEGYAQPEILDRAFAVAQTALALYPTDAEVACLAAWSAWAIGRGSVAGRILDEGIERHPEHELMALLDRFFGAGCLPMWAVAKPQ